MDSAPSVLVIPSGESSGTVVLREGQQAAEHAPTDVLTSPTKQPNSPTEDALESQQVVELQTFIERKAWIEEKIKFLEKLPPIEVFVGIEALETSQEQVPGLPTRELLRQWLAEHDIIEKETEIFDTGELKKLRKTTRAATQRNLSPDDTDLIELTLTTIYELDKLLHLLRDRSENLDLLGVRLTWEENRIASWVARRQLIADLKTFLDTRARWSPSVYENPPAHPPPLPNNAPIRRRGSAASLASVASESALSLPGFSRTARFTQAELLSRDSAQFAGRVTALRHGTITTAGKILDKLIDNSRRPVPEILLDEQDKLEEMGIAQLEHINKFVMNVIMQWRKADETYVETMKDQVAANNLLSDIEMAKFQHPTARLSTSFMSRVDTLRKRLALRGDPTSRGSAFPCPTHPLFPEQDPFNRSLAQSLSAEITSALATLKAADIAAGEYRASYEAVKVFETLTQSAQDFTSRYIDILKRLETGVQADQGAGFPPNLHSDLCLNPAAHSVFLALLPSILDEVDTLDKSTAHILKTFPAALFRINAEGVDAEFKQAGVTTMDRLKECKETVVERRSEVSGRVDRLREARRLISLIDNRSKQAEVVQREISVSLVEARWHQSIVLSGAAPPTPESPPAIPLPSLPSDMDFQRQVDDLGNGVSRDIASPLHTLATKVEPELGQSLQNSFESLLQQLEHIRRNIELLSNIKAQSSVMKGIQDEVNVRRLEIEDLKVQYDGTGQDYLQDQMDELTFTDTRKKLTSHSEKLRVDVLAFIEALPSVIPFVGRTPSAIESPPAIDSISAPLPFSLRSLDDAVRQDCNDFSMRLSGDLRSLEQKEAHLCLAKMAKDVDVGVTTAIASLCEAGLDLSRLMSVHHSIGHAQDVHASLTGLLGDIDALAQSSKQRAAQCLSSTRELVHTMGITPAVNDIAVHEVLFLSRKRKMSDAELRLASFEEQIQAFRTVVADAQQTELNRLEELRFVEEERARAEQERLLAENAERVRLEKEEEERIRALDAKRVEELQLKTERARAIAEEEMRERLANERALQEERERKMEQERIEAENVRRTAEREMMEQERLAMELKLKQANDQLLAERMRAKGEEQERNERNRLLQEERTRMANQEHIEAENTRRLAEKKEREALEQQREALEQERLAMERKAKLSEEQLVAQRYIEADRLAEDLATKLRNVTEERSMAMAFPLTEGCEEDVFGLKLSTTEAHRPKSQEIIDLQIRILNLRKRLRTLSISSLARPASSSVALPTDDGLVQMNQTFVTICQQVAELPLSIDDQSAQVELDSLKHEVDVSVDLMDRIRLLVSLAQCITACDADLSDLLEHIDSYPALPLGPLASSYLAPASEPPEEQLKGRLAFTKSAIAELQSSFLLVSDDPRAVAEHQRVLQTWDELKEMAHDRLTGRKSRPSSVISSTASSGRNSSGSLSRMGPPVPLSVSKKKKAGYTSLSVSSRPRGGGLVVPPNSRRTVSNSNESRSSSRMSTASNRSTSGPMGFSVYSTTFASRQRTTSLTPATPSRRTSGTALLPRMQTPTLRRGAASPSISEISSVSNMASSRPSTSTSSWSRAPRMSLTPRSPKRQPPPRKTYVANPKSKLDIAVGDVVNNLPVGINIEGVSGSWKDQSGKYWIGDQDPRLCFCRILRSQTVMVRVGGGWQELSKFIRGHFADSFRLMSDSPQIGTREERWISATTLMETSEHPESNGSPPHTPQTPEPKGPYLPSFAISTPSGQSPQSLKSSPSSHGSPLTPLQFIRRANPETPFLRPSTPSTSSISRPRMTPTPVRGSIWRP